MVGPELADGSDDGGSNPGSPSSDSGSTGGSEPKVGTADLGIDSDDGLVAGFDGVEDEEESSEGAGSSGGGGKQTDPNIADSIEDGLAEVACIGLQGREREQVRSEMQSVASQFKIGYFGERTVEKYLKKDLDQIPPEYGLLATVIAFGAVVLYKRPDGEERVRNAFRSIKSRFGDDGEGDEQPTAEQPAPTPETDTSEEVQEVDDDNEQTDE